MLTAISPLDGRYEEKLAPLQRYFSEDALIRERCAIEIRYISYLIRKAGIFRLSRAEQKRLADAASDCSSIDVARVKEIESTVRHDVKAVEYYLRERFDFLDPNVIHFGLTSEDINNLAYSRLFAGFMTECQLPRLRELLTLLCSLAEAWERAPFPTRTHGQPASPSTAGKELAVFISRLTRVFTALKAFRFRGKLNGATGNYSAPAAAFPNVDWPGISRGFVESLALEFNPATTQIEGHDAWAEYFDLTRRLNNIVIDMNQDIWTYLMLGFLTQTSNPDEVGSSTMPHKVNPIRFENGEGNLQLSNGLLATLSDKLCRSRLQRDLSDSTVTRSIGTALAHSHLALGETIGGLGTLRLDAEACLRDLREHPELLAEPIQTILRAEGVPNPYERLKEFTRGKRLSPASLSAFIGELDVAAPVKRRLKALKVEEYVGLAPEICRRVVAETRRELRKK